MFLYLILIDEMLNDVTENNQYTLKKLMSQQTQPWVSCYVKGFQASAARDMSSVSHQLR